MNRFRSILVATTGAPEDLQSLELGREIARRSGAKLSLVASVDEVPDRGLRLLPGLEKTVLEFARKGLDDLVHRDGSQSLPEPRVLLGPRALELIKEVIRSGHDLLVKARDHTADGSPTSSTDMRLLRKCPCPVWLVEPTHSLPVRRVLAAVDTASDSQVRLNQQVLELARSVATWSQAELHVVHAYEDAFVPLLLRSMDPAGGERLRGQARDVAAEDLDTFVRGCGVQPDAHEVLLLDGQAAPAILEYVVAQDIDLVVMGTIARTGLPGLLIGNTAERVLVELRCGVLAVKPEGFVSPVRPV